MSKEADRARVRSLEKRIKSRRLIDGHYSVFGRAKESAIESIAVAIASNYPSTELDDADLRRVVGTHELQNPAAFLTQNEVTASLNKARFDEQNKKTVIRDITTATLAKLSPIEKLTYVNTGGELPRRIILKGPNEA